MKNIRQMMELGIPVSSTHRVDIGRALGEYEGVR